MLTKKFGPVHRWESGTEPDDASNPLEASSNNPEQIAGQALTPKGEAYLLAAKKGARDRLDERTAALDQIRK
jgi:hypothetical protein